MNALYLLIVCLTVYSAFGQDQFIKIIDEGTKIFKEKCLNVSRNEETFTEVQGAKDKVVTCIQGLVNVTVFQTELDEAKKRGAMEEVFGKYCKKKPELLGCVNEYHTTLEKCMEDTEKNSLKTARNISERLLDFVCYKDGDRIAMFIAEGGFKCIDLQKTEIEGCVNQTITRIAPKTDNDIRNIGDFIIIDEKKCE